MAYIPYSSREVLDREGNLSLFSDNSQQIYTVLDGQKIFFNLPEGVSGGKTFTKEWWGSHSWDLHAAEKEGDYIKLVTRARNNIDAIRDLELTGQHFEILTFDLNGNFISKEQAASGWRNHDTSYEVDAERIEKLQVKNWSPLEEWTILNRDLLTEAEYINNKYTRIEEWGHQKFREINPDDPMLEGYGVEISSPTKPGKLSNQETISFPDKFNKKSVDKITNFNPSVDTLEIVSESFGIDSSATFASGKNKKTVKKRLAKQDFDFLYDQKIGGLYFNANGADKGFGDGGIIAILKGAPDLTSDNLEFI